MHCITIYQHTGQRRIRDLSLRYTDIYSADDLFKRFCHQHFLSTYHTCNIQSTSTNSLFVAKWYSIGWNQLLKFLDYLLYSNTIWTVPNYIMFSFRLSVITLLYFWCAEYPATPETPIHAYQLQSMIVFGKLPVPHYMAVTRSASGGWFLLNDRKRIHAVKIRNKSNLMPKTTSLVYVKIPATVDLDQFKGESLYWPVNSKNVYVFKKHFCIQKTCGHIPSKVHVKNI